MNNMQVDLIISGAGPSGIFAAIQTAITGIEKYGEKFKIIILEKNSKPAKKLLISGSGQCNLTHSGDIADFFDHYGNNSEFLLSALYSYNNQALMNFFKKRDIKFRKAKGGKIFPASNKAEDILNVLLTECKNNGIQIIYNSPVKKVKYNHENKNFKIQTPQKTYQSRSFLIATGGKSFPKTGSSGDGYKFAADLGHTIIEPKPALAPVIIKNYEFKMLSGISLRKKELSLWRDNKLIKKWKGDLLLTHRGLSGPAIINYSRYIRAGDFLKVKLLNYNRNELEKDLLKKIKREGKLNLINLLIRYPIAQRLIEKILKLANIEPKQKAAHLTKSERRKIIDLFLELEFEIKNLANFNQSMVTKGGIDLKEINPGTMESYLIDNLFAVGEVLNIDGDTGGYNLQAAFSTAYLAAQKIANNL